MAASRGGSPGTTKETPVSVRSTSQPARAARSSTGRYQRPCASRAGVTDSPSSPSSTVASRSSVSSVSSGTGEGEGVGVGTGVGSGVGEGVGVGAGVAVGSAMAACENSHVSVSLPAMPSSSRLCLRWNAFTARRVLMPNLPSTASVR